MDKTHAAFVSTLIAPVGEKSLSGEVVDDFCRQLGAATHMEWLDEGVACDIFSDVPHLGFESPLAFDFIHQPAAHRRKKLLVADMDSTLIQQECIDELAAALDKKDEVAAITERAMNGELAFEEALEARVRLLAGLPEAALQEVFTKHITLMSGARTLAATMKAQGAYLLIVSGGFDFFTSRVREALGFDEDQSNQLILANGALAGAVKRPILGQDAKLEALVDVASRLGIEREEVLAVGDGANDIPMLKAAGLGIAYRAKPTVQAQCEQRITHHDLKGLLYAQGIPSREWVLP
jgi:phosphoserine phosphatase